jgi:hypothetical protein
LFRSLSTTHPAATGASVRRYTQGLEFGPPDKQAQLQDGTTVAEWLTQRGYVHNHVSLGCGYGYPYYYGPFFPTYTDTYRSPDYFLRLIFGPDGRLKEWKRGSILS